MSEQDDEDIDSTNDTMDEEEEDETSADSDTDTNDDDTNSSADDDDSDDPAVLKQQLAEAKKQNTKLFERTKKAEGFVKVDGKWVKKSKPSSPEKQKQKTEINNQNKTEFVTPRDLIQSTKNYDDK